MSLNVVFARAHRKEDNKKFPKFEQCDMYLAQLMITNDLRIEIIYL